MQLYFTLLLDKTDAMDRNVHVCKAVVWLCTPLLSRECEKKPVCLCMHVCSWCGEGPLGNK